MSGCLFNLLGFLACMSVMLGSAFLVGHLQTRGVKLRRIMSKVSVEVFAPVGATVIAAWLIFGIVGSQDFIVACGKPQTTSTVACLGDR